MDKKIYLSFMAALATAAVLWFLAVLIEPFARSLAWALIIGVATMPHYERLVRWFPRHADGAAVFMVLGIALCIILPAVVLIVMIAQNAAQWYSQSEELILAFTKTLPETLGNFPFINRMIMGGDKLGMDLAGYLAKFASAASAYLLAAATATAKNLASLFFTLAMALFILFFVYRDGSRIVSQGVERFAADKVRAERYLCEIRSATTAIVVGTILTCLAQGTLAGVGYYIADTPAPVLCGALTAAMALIPLVGTAIVWVPLAGLLIFKGAFFKAGFLVIWCLVFVSLADNAIRPLAIGARKNIPLLAIVLGAVGGVTAIGLIGLIIGPLFFTVLAVLWREAVNSRKPGCSEAGAMEGGE